MAITLKTALHTIAQEVLREQADQDYISARANYRMDQREQFLWASLQACEKYLKAVLLFNERSARYDGPLPSPGQKGKNEFGHDLVRLFKAVRMITDLPLDKPDWLPQFSDYLTRFGNNRYLTKATYAVGDELRLLDEAVWTLRRFCQSFDWSPPEKDGSPGKNLRPQLIAHVANPARRENPALDRPLGAIDGHLEKVLKRTRNDAARAALVWKNLFYAKRQRHTLLCVQHSSSANPPHTRDWFNTPAITDFVNNYFKL